MKFFRTEFSDESASPWKYIFWGAIMLLIVGSFIVQMAMGLCPVP